FQTAPTGPGGEDSIGKLRIEWLWESLWLFLLMKCIYAIIVVKYQNDAWINFGEGVTLEMINRLDDNDPPITFENLGRKHKRSYTVLVVCLLFLVPIFVITGCGPLVTTDPQSNVPLGDADTDSRPGKTWPVKRTLVSNEVNCIAADPENVWIATARGVSRWERQQDQWLHYTMEDGLANDMVNAVAIDGQWVWFATDEGVSRYDIQTDTFSTFRTIDGLASDQVSSISVDGNYVWFGTSNGLNRYDKTIDSWAVRTRKDGLVSKIITTIAVEPDYVWVGTDREINPDPHGWDEDPRFSKGGVSRYHRDTDSWNNYTKSDGLIDSEIATIAVDDDSVWFGTQKEGVSQYNQVDQTFIKTYTKTDLLKSNMITCIRSDGFQVWFGTANAGVHRFIKPVNTWVHYTQADGLSSNHVSWITTQGNDVWFATKEDGVSRFDKVTGKWTIYKQADFLADNDVRAITRDTDGNLWIATVAGISVYAPQTRSWEIIAKEDGLPTPYVTSIFITSHQLPVTSHQSPQKESLETSSAVWVGTDRGLGTRTYIGDKWIFHTPKQSPVTSHQSPVKEGSGHPTDSSLETGNSKLETSSLEAFVTAIDADTTQPNPVIWLGTSSGPAMYDPTSQEWQPLAVPDAPQNPLILSVRVHEKSVWFAGAEGVWRYSIADKKMHRAADGLPDPYVSVLLSTGEKGKAGTLWAGTHKGLARYDSTQQRWLPLPPSNIEKSAQLPSPNVTALAFRDGILWIGTPQGLGSYTIETKKWNSLSNVPYNIRDIFCEADGTLWLATDIGLLEYHNGYRSSVIGHRLKEIPVEPESSLTDNQQPTTDNHLKIHQSRPVREPFLEVRVSDIKFDGDYIWFNNWKASPNGGIVRFHRPTTTWRRFTRLDILQSTQKRSMTFVRWIYVDTDAVWFTTDYGVLRYDKMADTWQHFTKEDGLSTDDVDKIAISEQSVWVIPMIGLELNHYSKATGTWDVVEEEGHREIERIKSLGVDGPNVWFASGRGLTRYNEITGEWKNFGPRDGLAGRGAEWITIDDDFIWVARSEWDRGSNRPLSRYDKKTKEWTTFSTNDVLAAETIRRIIATKKDVWILYRPWDDAGVTRYDRRTKEWTTIKSGRGTLELAADDDYLWLAAPNEGLRRFHFASGTWTTFKDIKGLLHNHVGEYGLAVDEDYVWVGTLRGLSRYDKRKESWTPLTALPTVVGRTVRTVDADERFVWVGTDEGMSRYDQVLGTWKNYRQEGGSENIETHGGHWHQHGRKKKGSLSDNVVSSIVVDEQYVWIGTRDGVNRFDKIALQWDQYKTEHGVPANNVTSVSSDGDSIWVGTNSGIGKYPRTADDLNAWITYTSGTEIQPSAVSKEFAESLVTDEIWCITASKKHVWVGTRRGVSKYDIGRDIWKTITIEDGLASDEVSCIAIDRDNVWFGSDRGVTLYNEKTDVWAAYTTEDGLASNKVTTIGVDGTDVWIGTYNAGVSRFDQVTDTWTTYTREDGLAHNGILSMVIGRNYVWFGTYRGLSRFDKRTGTWTTFTESYGPEDILR
ncbi:hypothetical protein F4Y19_18490, partial [Candidatus Poribacteria bacterium]|nr:hypothetical protein [Candidatus Poribacteria bacterium]